MIFVTGDTHGEKSRISEIEKQTNIKSGDYLIVCGDFGYIYLNDDSEKQFLDNLSQKPYTILFIDGNHECFPAIYEYPVVDFNGADAHQIRQNIFHIMRGQTFIIEGKSFFTMGGAYSIDKSKKVQTAKWWKEELPNSEEYKTAALSLKRADNKFDYIITHTAPKEIIYKMGYTPDQHDIELTGFLEYIMYECEYNQWFFGHFHEDKQINSKFRALFKDVEEI